ncbi:MAG: hypothetical protein PHS62_01820 [Patescibacteria group bacterium]|nr:hypothetical protein [Patescibacteria group bacterium]
MKQKKLITAAIALTLLASTAGIASTVLAADNAGSLPIIGKFFGGERKNKPAELTAAQKAAMQTKTAAVKTALENSDYNAWVTAVKAINENAPELKKVTTGNFSEYAAKFKDGEAKMAEQQTKAAAVKTALKNGDYNAWVAAVKALDASAPILDKVNANNFSRYVQANNLRQQADTILQELGVNGPAAIGGRGPGHGPNGDRGFGGGRFMGADKTETNN